MKTPTLSTPKTVKGFAHLAVLLLVMTLISFFFPVTKIGENYLWQPLGQLLLAITAFYAHSLYLLPILLRQSNLKKYLLLAFFGFLLFWMLALWFEALHSSEITRMMDGSISDPIVFIQQADWLIYSFLFLLIGFLPFAAVSSIYYLLIIAKTERQAFLSSKYAEIIINAFVLIPIFLLFIVNTHSNQEKIKVFFEVLLFALFFYTNAVIFVKILFREKKPEKYLLFVLLSFVLVVAGTGVIYGAAFLTRSYYENIVTLGIFFFIVFSLSLIYGYIRLKIKADEQVFSLKLGAKESELSLLKSQVNPHFLFNTLNTMYATALEEKAPKTAEGTAKLANLIRYMQNDIQKDFIPLENEIKYMEDYIAIQKLRCEVPPNITTEFRKVHGKSISPGLLIPFVENAFKYGLNPTKPSELSVAVICDENSIFFECTNTYDEDFSSSYAEQGFGIGIRNTEQRLGLVYPKTHSLDITRSENVFSVKLSITPKK